MAKIITPRGAISEMNRVMKGSDVTDYWVQKTTDNISLKEKLTNLCCYPGKDFEVSIILHRCMNSVDKHRDSMSKSCYIVPVSITGEWIFHCEYRSPRKLAVGDMIKFNDFNWHELEMTKIGTAKFYTIAFNKDYYD